MKYFDPTGILSSERFVWLTQRVICHIDKLVMDKYACIDINIPFCERTEYVQVRDDEKTIMRRIRCKRFIMSFFRLFFLFGGGNANVIGGCEG